MNYQSLQAIRIFYTRSNPDKLTNEVDVRAAYSLLAVLTSTGLHPHTGYKVFPSTSAINSMLLELLELLLTSSKVKTNRDTDFNFWEVKIYLGNNMFANKDTGLIVDGRNEPLRRDCNKVVNSHNDVWFGNNSWPKNSDTVYSDQPTVTFSVGSTR